MCGILIYGNAAPRLPPSVVLLDQLDSPLVDIDSRQVVHVVVFLPIGSTPHRLLLQHGGVLADGWQLDCSRGAALRDQDFAGLPF